MSKVHNRHSAGRIVAAIICFLLFTLLTGAAIYFDGIAWKDIGIMSALCLITLLFCLLPFHTPWPIAILALITVPSICFVLLESFSHIIWETMEMDAIILNLIFYYLLILFLYLITGNLRLSLMIEVAFTMFTGIANFFVILFRSTPILPWDLLSLGTALSVANNYTFRITKLFAELAGGFLLLFVFCCRMPKLRISYLTKRIPTFAARAILRLVLILLLCIPTAGYIRFIFQPDIAEKTSLDNTLFTPKYMYKTNGFFVAFLMDLRLLQVEEPDNYTIEAAETLLAEQQVSATALPEELPSILVIMNECFSNPSILGEFETNVDYMPNVSKILEGAENTVSGYVYASVLGGNTANSEYEFLTGNTMAFLPSGSVPYQQYVRSEVPTIVEQFKDFGYETYAMHPYGATGWNRNTVYPWMHFDESFFYSDFKNKIKLRKYVSDASNYENVLRVYRSTEEPVFIFNVTMQNHSGYGDSYDNFTPEVSALFKKTKSNRYLNNYLSLIKISDQAIADLLTELENERPTIVVFFGDHQPNDYVVNPIYKEQGLSIDNQTLEQQQTRQAVPFFIWANYDIEEQTDLSISLNYLSSLLFDVAKLPMTNYQSFLYDLYKKLPVLNAIGYIDNNANCNYIDEATAEIQTWLDEYRTLQYYNMFDQYQN